MDHVAGWLLHLPSDAALVFIALSTALLLALIRVWTTDQDLLRRIAADKRTLRQLARQARAEGDPARARRHRENLTHITWQTLGRTLRGEGLTLVVSLVPLVLLGTWCFYRLEYHPPRAGETIELSLLTPVTDADSIVHLAPQPGVHCHSSWARQVAAEDSVRLPRGIARWQLSLDSQPQAYDLRIRIGQMTLTHPVLVGQTRYLPPDLTYMAYSTHVSLRPVRLFDRLPGIPWLALPAWAVGYLLIAVPGTLVLKRVMGIH
jgi:hypothetical protein